MSKWTDFIKSWAAANNVTYGCAMSDPKMKEEYYKKHPKQTKEDKKREREESLKKQKSAIFKSSLINFRDKYVKPHLANPNDSVLKNDMINKYRKFSEDLKEFIKQKAPKIHNTVSKPAEAKSERQRKKGLQKPKKEPKKAEPKKPEPKKSLEKSIVISSKQQPKKATKSKPTPKPKDADCIAKRSGEPTKPKDAKDYKKQSLKFHPDRPNGNLELFQKYSAAYSGMLSSIDIID